MSFSIHSRPRIGGFMLAVWCLAVASLAARVLAAAPTAMRLWYGIMLGAYLALFLGVSLLTEGGRVAHVAFGLQVAIILALFVSEPRMDFITALFVPLCYQAAVVLAGRARWVWIGAFVVLIGAVLALFYGPLRGLALGLTSMTLGLILPASHLAAAELTTARVRSERTVGELRAANEQLQEHAEQVAELVVLEERNRLARELHDSVSQTMFGVLLTTESARILLERDNDSSRRQIERLQPLTQDALDQMRALIAHLRPEPARPHNT